MKKKLYWLLLFCLAVNLVAIKTFKTVNDEWPPYSSKNIKTGGLSNEIITAAFKNQGYSVSFDIVPWARAIRTIDNGSVDFISNLVYSEKRAKKYIYSNSYITNRLVFVKKNGDNFEFNDYEDLSNKKIGIVRGYFYTEKLTKATNFKKIEAKDFKTNLKKLLYKRIDLAIDDEKAARYIVANELPSFKNKIDFCKKAVSIKELHIAVSKNNPQGKAIIKIFNKGLKEIKENGTYDEIIKKYN